MSQEQLTPEQLAKEFCNNFVTTGDIITIDDGERAYSWLKLAFEKAIQAAIEPLQREIDRQAGEIAFMEQSISKLVAGKSQEEIEREFKAAFGYESVNKMNHELMYKQNQQEKQIKQLESDNALLVEVLGDALEQLECDPLSYKHAEYCVKCRLQKALTNTTQAAQARDKKLKEAVIDECIRVCEEELDSVGDVVAALNQLKGGE